MIDDERAIRELVQTWMTATKADDIQTVLSLMTDDVVFMTPGNEPFGKEVFAATAEQMKDTLQILEGTKSGKFRCLAIGPVFEVISR